MDAEGRASLEMMIAEARRLVSEGRCPADCRGHWPGDPDVECPFADYANPAGRSLADGAFGRLPSPPPPRGGQPGAPLLPVTSPADNTDRCPVCGLSPQVRGCEPGKCRGGAGFSVVHAPVRAGAPFAANPGDFFNGHPLSAFCEACRLGILEIGRTERLSVTVCAACTEMMRLPSPVPAAPPAHPGDRCARSIARPCDEQRGWVGHQPGGADFDHAFVRAFADDAASCSPSAQLTSAEIAGLTSGLSRLTAALERAGVMEAALRGIVRLIGDRPAHPDVAAAIRLLAEIDAEKATP